MKAEEELSALDLWEQAEALTAKELPKQPEMFLNEIDDHEGPATRKDTALTSTETLRKSRGTNFNGTLLETQVSPTAWARLKELSHDWWLKELIFTFTSLCAITSVAAILFVYHNKPLRQWKSSITINTVVSVLIVVSKAAMLLAVTPSLSQMKWHWFAFGRPRVFSDVQVFDDASRGPLGSLQFLIRTKNAGISSFGALIILVSLAIDPFAQQLLSFPQKQVQDASANIGRVLNYTIESITYYNPDGGVIIPTGYISSLTALPPSNMLSAIYAGTFGSPTPLQQTCTSGHCTWPDFSSLSFCSQCKTANGTFNRHDEFSNGTYISPSNITWNINFNDQGTRTINVAAFVATSSSKSVVGATEPILGFARFPQATLDNDATYSNIGEALDPHPPCTECALSFCVQRFSPSVKSGVVTMQSYSPVHGPGDSGNIEISSPNPASFPYGTSLSRYFALQFASQSSADLLSQLSLPNNVTQTMSNIATSLTNALLNQAFSEGKQQPGISFNDVTFIKVRWPWLALPVSLSVSSLAFLLVVILRTSTRSVPLWKASILATLFHQLQIDGDVELEPAPTSTLTEMEARSNALRIALKHDKDNDWSFVAWPDREENM